MLFRSFQTFKVLLTVGIFLLFVLHLYEAWDQRRLRRSNELEATRIAGGARCETIESLIVTHENRGGIRFPTQLSLSDRIELYNRVFHSTGNQLPLEQKHIDCGMIMESLSSNDNINSSDATLDVEFGNVDEEEETESSLESDRLQLVNESSTLLEEAETSTIERREEDGGHDNDENYSESTNESVSSGTWSCAICYEEFAEGEIVVRSENPSCRHVYHKKCMVHYLASNAEKKKPSSRLGATTTATVRQLLDLTENPCPSCRRNYCTVREEDLVETIIAAKHICEMP